jgi:molecular chaperone DnaJ
MPNLNPYEVLDVDPNASADEIKKAYKKLAKKYHPDSNKDTGASDNFKDVSEAYDILGDAESKRQFDMYGRVDKRDGVSGYGNPFGADMAGGFFNGFFNHNHRQQTYNVDPHIAYDMEISFLEATFGCDKHIIVNRHNACQDCKGNGSHLGNSFNTCIVCNGTGSSTTRQGPFVVSTSCAACGGARRTIKEKCQSCSGSCLKSNTETFQVKIPAGTNNHSQFVLAGAGNCWSYGQYGDIYCTINVANHPLFYREEQNVICDLPISYHLAVLGGSIDVPHINGKLHNLAIPAFTSHGKEFVICDCNAGQFIVRVKLCLPDEINDNYKDFLTQNNNLSCKTIDIFRESVTEFTIGA